MFELGSYIKSKREALNISSRKLANIVGISSTEMMKIENGTRKNPSWNTLCKVARAIKVHPFDVLCAAGYINETDINPALRLTGIEKLDKDELKEVQTFIDFIIERKKRKAAQNEI
jgi:HTH-type transcriptional regulator, competence development regulator